MTSPNTTPDTAPDTTPNTAQPTDAADHPTTADCSLWPTDARTGQPLAPRAQPGYYPGFSTLDQQAFWDDATRRVVLDRVRQPPPIRFFTPAEAQIMRAIIARILPQDDRDAARQIPILNYIDERLYSGRIDGYRYDDMPPDDDAHRLGIQAIDQIAHAMFGAAFIALAADQQERVLQTLHDCAPPAAHDIFARMSCQRYWMLLVKDCVEAYYAHPWAWDEIGFGGPSYPRGYMRLQHGKPEPWEKDEVRYEWSGPPWTVSDAFEPIGGGHETITPGQSGTH